MGIPSSKAAIDSKQMDHINLTNYQPGFAKAPCTWLAVNGMPIEKWCAEAFAYPDAIHLGLAQMCLVDEAEDRLACSRLIPGEENSSTIVPILVCSDDMDLSCTVLVVEQLISNQTVQWLRWGFSVSCGADVGISTKWEYSQKTPLAIFELTEFETCVRRLDRS